MEHPSPLDVTLHEPDHSGISAPRKPLVVLKEGELFFVQTQWEDEPNPEGGLFFQDTRYLQALSWWLGEVRPLVLSSGVYDTTRAQIDLTNPDMTVEGQPVPAHSIHVRVTLIVADRLYERLRIINFLDRPLPITLRCCYGADFRDIFEVRGHTRPARGSLLPAQISTHQLTLGYRGLDDKLRTTTIWSDPAPDTWLSPSAGSGSAIFHWLLDPRHKRYHYTTIAVQQPEPSHAPGDEVSAGRRFSAAALKQARLYRQWDEACTRFESDNAIYNAMLRQATTDMRALLTEYPGQGRIVDAGIPWYVAPFGRDACVTGIETLLLNPSIARDSLRFLARLQGTQDNPWRDEEPGKIPHELRRGEMAACGEIPHTPYYGSVDATLWWIIALYETWRFTGDHNLLMELRDPLRQAYRWILDYGDYDRDGLVEYLRRSPMGLDNQGWKDSFDSVRDEEGAPVSGPIALVEVQGYAYRALVDAAAMFGALGDQVSHDAAFFAARRLKARFFQAFAQPSEKRLAYALDGAKNPIVVPTSNPGHLLFTQILDDHWQRTVARRLFHPDLASGFGIRTLSETAAFYNPMSYHNGTVWPHDNAIIAWGLKRMDEVEALTSIARQLYEAAQYFPAGRLPELYCGFTRRAGAGPVHYPVACDPQAWSAATPFLLLRLLLGISVHGPDVHIRQPVLPPWVNDLYIQQLAICGGHLDIEFSRRRGVTAANVVRHTGDFRVLIEPATTKSR